MSYNFSEFKQNLKKVEEWLGREYGNVHTGRAIPMILDNISVESYGSQMPLKNVGSISIEDPKTLRVVPWDKSLVKEIERAIAAANLGLSTGSDNEGVRIIFPQLTTETRQRLVKALKEKFEEARISVRKERDEVLSSMKSANLPEDDMFRAKEEVQKHVDEANLKLEAVFEKKEREVMS